MGSESTFRFAGAEVKANVASNRTSTLLNKMSNQNMASVSL